MLNKLMKNKKGFTLIELIVVIAILGILAAVLVPSISNYVTRANQSKADSAAGEILQAARRLQTEMDAQLSGAPTSLKAGIEANITGVTVTIATTAVPESASAVTSTTVYITGTDSAPTAVLGVVYVDGDYKSIKK